MPLERAISEFRFAYSANKSATSMEPPPNVPLLSDFPDYISSAFENAFGRNRVQDRPKAETWVSLLERLEHELQQCSSNSAHHHVKGKPCPWCRMEQANPGFVAFTSNQPVRTLPTSIDTISGCPLINSVKDPGTPPDIYSVVQAPANPAPSGTSSAIIASLRKQYGIGIGASIVWVAFPKSGRADFALLSNRRRWEPSLPFIHTLTPRRSRRPNAWPKPAWRTATDAWSRQAGNKKFLEIKADAQRSHTRA